MLYSLCGSLPRNTSDSFYHPMLRCFTGTSYKLAQPVPPQFQITLLRKDCSCNSFVRFFPSATL